MEYAGARCVFSSEWDAYAQETYAANFGERPAGDITQIPLADIPPHDFLVAGFPCQSFSICGEQKGFGDARGTLFFRIVEILEDKRPRGFLLENVRNLVRHDEGRTFATILSALHALGYHVHWTVLDGRTFGVPQKRERTVIVGFRENHPFVFPKAGFRPARSLSDILEDDRAVDPRHFLSPRMKAKLRARVGEVPAAPAIWHENKSGNVGVNPFSCALRAGASYNYLTVNGVRRLTPREMLRLQGFPESFKIVVPDTQIRKQAGNSVVVPKMEAVAAAMIAAVEQPPLADRPVRPWPRRETASLCQEACL
jgi:DNA (cytosine-5)-methyltransferase 1